MTDVAEKDYNNGNGDDIGSGIAIYERPTGIKGIYYHPITQVSMLGLVCFMCPGMTHGSKYILDVLFMLFFVGLFNALTGLGAGGQVDPTTSAKANTALYATFALGAFFSGYI
jgi:hypothetical protein